MPSMPHGVHWEEARIEEEIQVEETLVCDYNAGGSPARMLFSQGSLDGALILQDDLGLTEFRGI